LTRHPECSPGLCSWIVGTFAWEGSLPIICFIFSTKTYNTHRTIQDEYRTTQHIGLRMASSSYQRHPVTRLIRLIAAFVGWCLLSALLLLLSHHRGSHPVFFFYSAVPQAVFYPEGGVEKLVSPGCMHCSA